MNLNNSLSVAEEKTLPNFSLDAYIPQLVEIIKRPPLTDISPDIISIISCYFNFSSVWDILFNSSDGYFPSG
jgi:hypothetical protein